MLKEALKVFVSKCVEVFELILPDEFVALPEMVLPLIADVVSPLIDVVS